MVLHQEVCKLVAYSAGLLKRIYAKHLYQDLASAKDSTSIIIPEVKNGDLRGASYVLQNLNIQSNSSSIPKSSTPILGHS